MPKLKPVTVKAMAEAGVLLKELRAKKNAIEEAARLAKEPVDKDIDLIEQKLLIGLKELGLSNISLDTGEKITRSVKQGLLVTNEYFATQWAKENGAVKIDLRMAAQKLKELETMPAGFEKAEREEIRVTLPKPAELAKKAEAS